MNQYTFIITTQKDGKITRQTFTLITPLTRSAAHDSVLRHERRNNGIYLVDVQEVIPFVPDNNPFTFRPEGLN